ncbi:MAG: alpha/beta fold hydrolase [Thermodesulfobacteriota bacterium]
MVTRTINGKATRLDGFRDIYPFQSNYTSIQGLDMHYVDQGKGEPVIMVHGNPTWSFYFRRIIADLSDGYRAIAPDHIGCGLSDKPGDKEYPYTLERRVADLDRFISRVAPEEKISFVLHDWGGMIGLAWILDNPDRIKKVVITNTSGFFLPENKSFPLPLRFIKHCPLIATPLVLGLNIFSRGAVHTAAKTRLHPKVRKGLTAPYNSRRNRIATLRFVQDIPLSKKDPSYRIVEKVEKRLHLLNDLPILILWGRKDFVFDMHFFREWQRRLPEARMHVFENAGHYLFEDRPDETSGLIREFLDNI